MAMVVNVLKQEVLTMSLSLGVVILTTLSLTQRRSWTPGQWSGNKDQDCPKVQEKINKKSFNSNTFYKGVTNHAMGVINGKLLVVGGISKDADGNDSSQNVIYELNVQSATSTGQWRQSFAKLQHPRHDFVFAKINRKHFKC